MNKNKKTNKKEKEMKTMIKSKMQRISKSKKEQRIIIKEYGWKLTKN